MHPHRTRPIRVPLLPQPRLTSSQLSPHYPTTSPPVHRAWKPSPGDSVSPFSLKFTPPSRATHSHTPTASTWAYPIPWGPHCPNTRHPRQTPVPDLFFATTAGPSPNQLHPSHLATSNPPWALTLGLGVRCPTPTMALWNPRAGPTLSFTAAATPNNQCSRIQKCQFPSHRPETCLCPWFWITGGYNHPFAWAHRNF
jgi:hypothetical protein